MYNLRLPVQVGLEPTTSRSLLVIRGGRIRTYSSAEATCSLHCPTTVIMRSNSVTKEPEKGAMGMRLALALSAVLAGVVLTRAPAAEPAELVYLPSSSKRVCQLSDRRRLARSIGYLSQTSSGHVLRFPFPLS
jgi:hypothetical protein